MNKKKYYKKKTYKKIDLMTNIDFEDECFIHNFQS